MEKMKAEKMKAEPEPERRGKKRFPMQRELRYKLIRNNGVIEAGAGQTIDIGSDGVGVAIGRSLPVDSLIELSISWPVLLDQTCPIRLVVFGRVEPQYSDTVFCSIDRYEFRTQARIQPPLTVRDDLISLRRTI